MSNHTTHRRRAAKALRETNQDADFLLYKRLADKFRTQGAASMSETEMAELKAVEERRAAKRRAELAAQPPQGEGWWNLPMARWAWEGDARDRRAV